AKLALLVSTMPITSSSPARKSPPTLNITSRVLRFIALAPLACGPLLMITTRIVTVIIGRGLVVTAGHNGPDPEGPRSHRDRDVPAPRRPGSRRSAGPDRDLRLCSGRRRRCDGSG